MSQVASRSLEWLWPGWVPLAKLTLVDGDPEQGKSTFALDLAARVSQGQAMPDARPGLQGDVTLLTAEDGLEDMVLARLQAAQADLSRIHVLKAVPIAESLRMPALPQDVLVVEKILRDTDSRLLVVETGMAQLTFSCLQRLAVLADQTRCAVVLLRYLNKKIGGKAIYRGGGGIGILGAARSGLLVAADPGEEQTRILASTKNNLGVRPASLRFVLEPISAGVCKVRWLGPSPLTADELLAAQASSEGKTVVARAQKFLREFLQDGPMSVDQCYAEARKQQISERTLRRAKHLLGVILSQERDLLGLLVPATWELANS